MGTEIMDGRSWHALESFSQNFPFGKANMPLFQFRALYELALASIFSFIIHCLAFCTAFQTLEFSMTLLILNRFAVP